MNTQQIQQEMAKYQAEMMALQTKYATPTPENIAKMQQEMATLNQKIAELSMQYTTASMAENYGDAASDLVAQAYANASAGNFDPADALDDEETEEALLQFIEENRVAPEKEKYMPIGALLLASHGEPWQILALINEEDYWQEVLEEGWDIKNIKAGRKMLASLLEGRHAMTFGEEYKKFKSGKAHELDDDSVEAYNDNLECIEEYFPDLLPYAKKCDNILAWDLERVGYLARIFYRLEWIDEQEVFDWLAQTAEKIKVNFSSWEEYVASILIGRAIAFSFDDVMVELACEFMTDGKEFLKTHPIR